MSERRSVLQDWVQGLTFMQQTVLLTAIRGPDGIPKYHVTKYLLRWYRRCVLLSSLDNGKVFNTPYEAGGGSFMGPSYDASRQPWGFVHASRGIDRMWLDTLVGEYLRSLDELPHHFQLHLMHSAQIVGYKHPNETIRAWWQDTYYRLVNDMHLFPETEEQMDLRLGDSREQWLARNDEATSD